MLSSPQFQSALSAFHSGLTSGQLGPLMSQFGLGEGVAQSAASGGEGVLYVMGKVGRRRGRKFAKLTNDYYLEQAGFDSRSKHGYEVFIYILVQSFSLIA